MTGIDIGGPPDEVVDEPITPTPDYAADVGGVPTAIESIVACVITS